MRIKIFLLLSSLLTLSACGLTPAEPYIFYSGPEKPAGDLSIIEVQRSFGGPAVIIKTVNRRHVLSYKSMSGYPADLYEENRLEPRMITVQSGAHELIVVFAFVDVVDRAFSKFSVKVPEESENAKFVMARYEATLPFETRVGRVYKINYSWKQELAAKGVTFQVMECDTKNMKCINLYVRNVNPKPTLTFHKALPIPEDIRGE